MTGEPGSPGIPGYLSVDVHEASQPADGEAPTVVLVHGSLDRAASFRRVVRRLPDLRVVTYDRRGYQRSRGGGPTGLAGHVEDLLAILRALAASAARPAAVVGHSLGGDVALGAAEAEPRLVSAVGAYEPPLPWLGFRRGSQPREELDPASHAERFFRRMVSDGAWERLSAAERQARRADGPALSEELRSIRERRPFDPLSLEVPVVLGHGGPGSAEHHRRGVTWLASHLPGSELVVLPTASHGAHLSHPDAFADFVRRVVALGQRPDTGRDRDEQASA